jgi:hypothetical protein
MCTHAKAPQCYNAIVAHLCELPAAVLIRSARVSSKPRYFPLFASRRALVHQAPLTRTVLPPSGTSSLSNAALSSGPECHVLCFSPSCRPPLFVATATPDGPPPQAPPSRRPSMLENCCCVEHLLKPLSSKRSPEDADHFFTIRRWERLLMASLLRLFSYPAGASPSSF